MSPRKKATSKSQTTKASLSGQQIEDELNIIGAMYDDTYGLLEKEGDALIWGDVYHMLKK
jgi:hypothetical protein